MKKSIPDIVTAIDQSIKAMNPKKVAELGTNQRMSLPAQFERMAELKAKEKSIHEEIQDLQAKILDAFGNEDAPKKVGTDYGPLSKTLRSNTPKLDDDYIPEVVKKLGAKVFIKHATLSPAKLKKLAGETTIDEFVEKGLIVPQGKLAYYSLKCAACAAH